MTETNQPFVSVLTPVYNGEKYIAECIESVLNQTYQNWEYIIVNNCSTDKTPGILDHYAQQDSRIKIHSNEKHLGHLDNGNKAFALMSKKSKYCKVVHADDWIFAECIKKMVEIGEKYPTVGIVSSYRIAGRKVTLDGLPYPSEFVQGKKIARGYLLKGEFYFGSPTSLLLRSDLIRKREKIYDQSFVHSDIAACLDFLKESDFGFVHQVLTFTRRHDESVTSKIALKNETYQLERLHNVVTYGRTFLSDDEYNKRVKKREEEYYAGMAKKIIVTRSKDLFAKDYHSLKNINLNFKPLKLTKHMLLKIYYYLTMKLYTGIK